MPCESRWEGTQRSGIRTHSRLARVPRKGGELTKCRGAGRRRVCVSEDCTCIRSRSSAGVAPFRNGCPQWRFRHSAASVCATCSAWRSVALAPRCLGTCAPKDGQEPFRCQWFDLFHRLGSRFIPQIGQWPPVLPQRFGRCCLARLAHSLGCPAARRAVTEPHLQPRCPNLRF